MRWRGETVTVRGALRTADLLEIGGSITTVWICRTTPSPSRATPEPPLPHFQWGRGRVAKVHRSSFPRPSHRNPDSSVGNANLKIGSELMWKHFTIRTSGFRASLTRSRNDGTTDIRLSSPEKKVVQKQNARHVGRALSIQTGSSVQISLPSATAVSFMRLEKPHSLSYQVRMRTKVPPMTLVWSMWNVDECGS